MISLGLYIENSCLITGEERERGLTAGSSGLKYPSAGLGGSNRVLSSASEARV